MAFDIEPHILTEQAPFEEASDSARELATLALIGEVDGQDDIDEVEHSWRDETDPQAKVENFLDTNAHLLGAVTEAWKDVRVAQQDYLAFSASSKTPANRKQRRDTTQQGQVSDPRNSLGVARIKSQEVYKATVSESVVTSETLPELLAKSEEIVAKHRDTRFDHIMNTLPQAARQRVLDSEQLASKVTENRYRALLTQQAVLTEFTELLEDDAVVPVAIATIQDLAKKGAASHAEYPGFIELIATHVQQEGSENILQSAFNRISSKADSYAEEFIARQQEQGVNDHKRKELSAAFGVMNLMSDLMEHNFAIPAEDVRSVFARNVDAWPQALQQELHTYAASKTNAAWGAIKTSLEPYVREGRMQIESLTTTVNIVFGGKQGKPHIVATRGKNKRGINFASTSLEADHDAILEVSERKPISKFGVLVNSGHRSERYIYEEVDSLDELFTLSNLADYAKKYRSDPNVEPTLRKALEHLTTHPFDASCTRRLHKGNYTLEQDGEGTPRSTRRFSAQFMPGVRRGTPASKTRVFYDVIGAGSEQRLLIYGAFFKQDIESFVTLPRR